MSDLFIEEGEVLSITSSKTAKGEFFRIEVKDLDTDDTNWFGLGKDEPDYGEGSIVSFEYDESDDGKYLNAFADSVEVIDLVEPKKRGRSSRGKSDDNKRGSSRSSSSRGGSSRSSGRGGDKSSGRSGSRSASKSSGSRSASKGSKSNDKGAKSNGTDWEAKDKRTAIGFAREQAIKVLGAMLESGAVKLPAKAAEKYDAYLEFLDLLTARFLEQGDSYVEDGVEAIYSDADDD